MKRCLDKQCRRKGILLSLEEFPRNNARPDGRNGYCRECSVRKTNEHRAKMRPFHEAERKLAQAEREREFVATGPSPVELVKAEIERGNCTRNKIRAATRLPWDQISEALRELVLDTQTVKIEKIGELGFFVPAKAA